MKRFYGVVLAAVLVVTSVFGASNAQAQSDVNTFRITSFDIQYELSRDSESRSVLKTTPCYNKNKNSKTEEDDA